MGILIRITLKVSLATSIRTRSSRHYH